MSDEKSQTNTPSGSLKSIDAFRQDFRSKPKNRLALNVVTQNGIVASVVDRPAAVAGDHVYSHVISREGKPTAQKASGRCWLFAAMNVLRLDVMEDHKLSDSFEISQNFLFFWDKLEKSNFFLETILNNPDMKEGSRLFDHLMTAPINDGGQYGMIQNIISKYGLVPKSVYPETESATASRHMRWLITMRLRTFAKDLRAMIADGATKEQLAAKKDEQMNEVYRVLCISLGEPPHPDQKFDWRFTESKGNVHKTFRGLTPLAFRDLIDPDAKINAEVSLIHDPRNAYNTMYTVEHLGNVWEGRQILYLNVPLAVLKAACLNSLTTLNKAVWFGCEVGKFIDRGEGIMDTERFDYDLTFDMKLDLSKRERLIYGESCMTHAMVFTGVDLDEDGKAIKWKVENSWGDKRGNKGYYMMTDKWFDQYMFQAVFHPSALPQALQDVIEANPVPVPLPPWDPMGALASAM